MTTTLLLDFPDFRSRTVEGPNGGAKPPSSGGAEFPRPAGVPSNWIAQPSKKGGGVTYVNPSNPHDRVRVMPGNPNSPNPAQQGPYIKRQKDGKYYDKNSKEVPGDSPESHIPANEFKF